MRIGEAKKKEGEQDAGPLRAASAAQRGLRAWPPGCRKIQRWGRNLRFVTSLFVAKTAFSPAVALWRGLSMLAVQ
jgi:hypothetical protein